MNDQQFQAANPKPPKEKKGLLRIIELIDRDMSKFYRAGMLAFVGMIPFMLAVAIALANGAPIFLLACIPCGMIAAPELCGAADTVMRSMRDEIGWWWWDTYKRVWKENLKASLLPGGLFGFLIGAQLYSLYMITLLKDPTSEFWMFLIAALVETALLSYYMPMLVCMELPFPALLRNCFVLLFSHPIKSLVSAVLQLIYWIFILIWFPLTGIILLLTSVWLPMLISYAILYPALDKHFGLKETYEKMQKQQWEEYV